MVSRTSPMSVAAPWWSSTWVTAAASSRVGRRARTGTDRSPTSCGAGRMSGCAGCSPSVPTWPRPPLTTSVSWPPGRPPGPRPRALDSLSRDELSVLDALVVAGQTHVRRRASLVNADQTSSSRAIDRRRPGARLGLARGAAAAERRRRVADGGPEVGVSGLRPCRTDPGTGRGRGPAGRAVEPARAMLDHVLAARRRGDHRCGPADLRPDDASIPAEELFSRRLLAPAGPACSSCPGRSAGAAGWSDDGRPVDGRPCVADDAPIRAAVRRGRRGRGVLGGPAGPSCCSTPGAPRPPRRCGPAAWACATSRRPRPRCTPEGAVALLVETAASSGLLATAADG